MGVAATADVVVRSRQKGKKVYDDLEQRLDRLKTQIGRIGVLAGGAAAAGMTALTVKSFESADALAKQADRIGTSTEKLKTLQLLNDLAGGSTENLNKSLIKAQKALGEFNVTGSGTAAPFLRQLNLDTKALAELRPDQLFEVYAEKIRTLGSRSEQVAASAALFGDRTGEMLNLIDEGPEAFAEMESEVTRYGLALDRIDSAKIEAANDAMLKVRERMTGVGNVIASKVAPVVTAIANRFLETGTEADVMGAKVDKVMDGIARGAGLVADAIFGWKLLFAGIRVAMLDFAAGAVSGFATIERAVIIVRNKMSEAFGGEIINVRSGFLTQVEDSLKASSEHASQVLHELAQTERPSIKIADALAQARIQAEASAKAVAATREKLQEINAPTFDESEVEQRAREREEAAAERLRQQLSNKIIAIEQSLLTEEEREIEAYERRGELLEQALEQTLITKERAMEIEAGLFEQHQERLKKIELKGMTDRQKFEAKSGKDRTKQVFGELANITAGVATHNKTLFRINQAAAIGNAIINTAEGVTKTLAAYPMPYAAILAAAHLAAGLAQIATIRSASPGGGSTPSAIGTTPTLNDEPVPLFGNNSGGATAPTPGSQITIVVEGSLIGDQGIRDVLQQTFGELIDQDAIIIPPESTQAAVIRSGTGSGG